MRCLTLNQSFFTTGIYGVVTEEGQPPYIVVGRERFFPIPLSPPSNAEGGRVRLSEALARRLRPNGPILHANLKSNGGQYFLDAADMEELGVLLLGMFTMHASEELRTNLPERVMIQSSSVEAAGYNTYRFWFVLIALQPGDVLSLTKASKTLVISGTRFWFIPKFAIETVLHPIGCFKVDGDQLTPSQHPPFSS
ncbi:MAG TPA: hypothetical protein V6C81_11535 [Planktothrix sp.]|jgi:hypothetical protein